MKRIRTYNRRALRKSLVKKSIFIKRKIRIYSPYLLKKQFVFIAIASFLISFAGIILLIKIFTVVQSFHEDFSSQLTVKNSLLPLFEKKSNCFSCKIGSLYDPFILSQKIIKNDPSIIVVDIRSAQEYKNGHIKYAVNIPVYTKLNSIEASERSERNIIDDFGKIKNKTIILYGNSASSTIPSDVSNLLASNNIKSTILSIGWSEWYHFRNMWVPEGEWNSFDPSRYSILSNTN